MRKYQATWNGTMTQARDLVRAWKVEQERREREKKIRAFFSRGVAMRAAREAVFLNN